MSLGETPHMGWETGVPRGSKKAVLSAEKGQKMREERVEPAGFGPKTRPETARDHRPNGECSHMEMVSQADDLSRSGRYPVEQIAGVLTAVPALQIDRDRPQLGRYPIGQCSGRCPTAPPTGMEDYHGTDNSRYPDYQLLPAPFRPAFAVHHWCLPVVEPVAGTVDGATGVAYAEGRADSPSLSPCF